MKAITRLLLLFAFPLQAIELSDKMYVNERILSWTTQFSIESDQCRLGTVYRKFFSLTKEYHLEDTENVLQARAISRFWSLGMIFDIVDANDQPLGFVEERLLNFLPTFEIFSPSHQKLAKAKLNFWGTTYTVTDPIDDHIIATFYRPYFRLFNDWTVTIVDIDAMHEKGIHPHMFLVLIALQADRSEWDGGILCHSQPYTPFLEHLDEERKYLWLLEPSEEDYRFVDRCEPEIALRLLETNQFTDHQKAALLRVIER